MVSGLGVGSSAVDWLLDQGKPELLLLVIGSGVGSSVAVGYWIRGKPECYCRLVYHG